MGSKGFLFVCSHDFDWKLQQKHLHLLSLRAEQIVIYFYNFFRLKSYEYKGKQTRWIGCVFIYLFVVDDDDDYYDVNDESFNCSKSNFLFIFCQS